MWRRCLWCRLPTMCNVATETISWSLKYSIIYFIFFMAMVLFKENIGNKNIFWTSEWDVVIWWSQDTSSCLQALKFHKEILTLTDSPQFGSSQSGSSQSGPSRCIYRLLTSTRRTEKLMISEISPKVPLNIKFFSVLKLMFRRQY